MASFPSSETSGLRNSGSQGLTLVLVARGTSLSQSVARAVEQGLRWGLVRCLCPVPEMSPSLCVSVSEAFSSSFEAVAQFERLWLQLLLLLWATTEGLLCWSQQEQRRVNSTSSLTVPSICRGLKTGHTCSDLPASVLRGTHTVRGPVSFG